MVEINQSQCEFTQRLSTITYRHDINYTLQLLWIELGLAPLTQINLLVLQSHIDTTIKKRTGVFKIRVYEENVKWPCFVLAFGEKLINA